MATKPNHKPESHHKVPAPTVPAPAYTPPVLDATERPYQSNPFKNIEPSIEAFKLMAVEWLKLVGLTILAYLIVGIPALIGFASITDRGASPAAVGLLILSLILIIIPLFYATYGFTRMIIAAARGQVLGWRQSLPATFGQALALAWTTFLASIIIFLGFLAFIVPGVFFSIWYSQVAFVVVDEGLSGIAALRRSKELVRRRLIDQLGLQGINQLIPNLLSIIPYIGSFIGLVYTVITLPITAIRYAQLTQLSDEDRDEIPTNVWNYVVFYVSIAFVALAILLLVALIATGTYDQVGK